MTVRRDQVTAEVVAELAERLEQRLDDLAWPDLETVKRSTVREVARGRVEGVGDVHLKTYRAVRLSDRARDALAGSRGVRELRLLREARARGIPCVRPLAAGRAAGSFGTRSFLLTQTFAGAPMPRAGWAEEQARAAGRALRHAHDLGLHAPDLHPENLLIDDACAVRICDLTNAVVANPLEAEQRSRAIAYFCLGLDGLAADPVAAPLLEAYGATPAIRAEAQRLALRLRNRGMNAFGRRATRACKHTEVDRVSKQPRRVWYLHRPAEDLWRSAREFDTSAAPLRCGRRGAVWVTPAIVTKQREPAAAIRLFRAAYLLAYAGVPTPRPVALDLTASRGVVFSEHVSGADLAQELPRMSTGEARTAARALGNACGRLHAFGLRNRDLKLENLVRVGDRVEMVDLEGVRRRAPIETRGRGRDLGRLLASYRQAVGGRVDVRLLAEFERSYDRALACLGAKTNRSLRRHTEARAREWAETHRCTATPLSVGNADSATPAGA